jgi:hypothetical protein
MRVGTIKTQEEIVSLQKQIEEAKTQIPYLQKICYVYPNIEHWDSVSEKKFLFRTPEIDSVIDQYELFESEYYSYHVEEYCKKISIKPFYEKTIDADVYKIYGSICWEFIGYKFYSDEHNVP